MPHPFVQARNYKRTNGRSIRLIAMHTMEMARTDRTAENCARYFATTDKPASSHYCVDNNSIVQCVREQDVAYTAPGANSDGIHIELAGYARQKAAEWQDGYNQSMLRIAAALVKDICDRNNIPIVWLSIADVKAGKRGITSHNNISKAYGKSTHWDPGPDFPVEQFLALVRSGGQGGPVAPSSPTTPAPTTPTQPPMQRTYGTGWFKSAHPVVREGDRNDTVKHLQGLLNITADGVFGSGTKRAVVAVQQRAGLPADGIVGPDTWSRLHTVVKQGVSGPAVQEVQRQVGVADDGAFGPGTHAAVVSYQRGAGLAADGIVGPGTYRAMMR